jgi:hypothetical protein
LRDERFHRLYLRNPKASGRRKCRLAMRPGHAHQLDAGYLGKVLKGEQAETACANHSDANRSVSHHRFTLPTFHESSAAELPCGC